MEFLANILASIGTATAAEGTTRTIMFTWDEPTCPEELL